jgi:hypothetical protein
LIAAVSTGSFFLVDVPCALMQSTTEASTPASASAAAIAWYAPRPSGCGSLMP